MFTNSAQAASLVRSVLSTRNQKMASVAISLICLVGSMATASMFPAADDFTLVGSVTNCSNPSVWQSCNFDVHSFIPGSTTATLTFDVRNDSELSNSTTSDVSIFVASPGVYFFHMAYAGGMDTSHWRNVQLDVDSVLYVDQYGNWDNHLGYGWSGTAWQGAYDAYNIKDESGFNAATYVMTTVPEPATLGLLAVGGLALLRRKKN